MRITPITTQKQPSRTKLSPKKYGKVVRKYFEALFMEYVKLFTLRKELHEKRNIQSHFSVDANFTSITIYLSYMKDSCENCFSKEYNEFRFEYQANQNTKRLQRACEAFEAHIKDLETFDKQKPPF